MIIEQADIVIIEQADLVIIEQADLHSDRTGGLT